MSDSTEFNSTERFQELAGINQDKTSLADIDKNDFDNLTEFVEFVRDNLHEKGRSDEDLVHQLTEAVDQDLIWEALDKISKKHNLYYYADQNK